MKCLEKATLLIADWSDIGTNSLEDNLAPSLKITSVHMFQLSNPTSRNFLYMHSHICKLSVLQSYLLQHCFHDRD